MLRMIFPSVLVCASAVAVWSAGQISISPYDPVGGRLFPYLVGWVMLVLSAGYLLKEAIRLVLAVRTRQTRVPPDVSDPPMPVAQTLGVLGCFALAVALVSLKVVGLVVAIASLVVIGSLLLTPREGGRRGLMRQGAAALVAAVLLYAVSQVLIVETLGIRLP